MTEQGFMLDRQLQQDSHFICDLDLSALRLINDSRWLWLILVPRRRGVEELHDLDIKDQSLLLREIDQISRRLKQMSECEKINTGALGNIVRQLHIHIIARNTDDPNWPGPVWGYGVRQPYQSQHADKIVETLRKEFHV